MADKSRVIIEGKANEKLDKSAIARQRAIVRKETSRVASELARVGKELLKSERNLKI